MIPHFRLQRFHPRRRDVGRIGDDQTEPRRGRKRGKKVAVMELNSGVVKRRVFAGQVQRFGGDIGGVDGRGRDFDRHRDSQTPATRA